MSETLVAVDRETSYYVFPLSDWSQSNILGISNRGRRTSKIKIPVSSSLSTLKTSARYGHADHDCYHVRVGLSGLAFPDGTVIKPVSEWSHYNDYMDADFDSEQGRSVLPRYNISLPNGGPSFQHVVAVIDLDRKKEEVLVMPKVMNHYTPTYDPEWTPPAAEIELDNRIAHIMNACSYGMGASVVRTQPNTVQVHVYNGVDSTTLFELTWHEMPKSKMKVTDPAQVDVGSLSYWDVRKIWCSGSSYSMVYNYIQDGDGDALVYPYGIIGYYSGDYQGWDAGRTYRIGGAVYQFTEAYNAPEVSDYMHKIHSALSSVVAMPSESKVKLTKIALEDLRYISLNMIEFLKDLSDLKETLTPLKELWRKPLSPKSWANLWLSLRFGLRLTISDSQKLLCEIQKKLKRSEGTLAFMTSRARETQELKRVVSTLKIERHQKLYLKPKLPDKLGQLIYNIYTAGLFPTPLAIWEIIPYSFVVDWIIPVSKYLEHWDDEFAKAYTSARLEYILYSLKVRTAESGFRRTNTVLYQVVGKRYQRWHERTFPELPQTQFLTPELSGNIINVIDAVSLVIQRARR